MKKMTETKKWLGQRDVKGTAKDCFLFDSWFASKSPAEADMGVGDEIIGMV